MDYTFFFCHLLVEPIVGSADSLTLFCISDQAQRADDLIISRNRLPYQIENATMWPHPGIKIQLLIFLNIN